MCERNFEKQKKWAKFEKRMDGEVEAWKKALALSVNAEDGGSLL
jgi:hypothetical protein